MAGLSVQDEGRAKKGGEDHRGFTEAYFEEERRESYGGHSCYQPASIKNIRDPTHTKELHYSVLWKSHLNNNEVSTPFRIPNVFVPVLHEGGIVFVFRLELRETSSQDEDLVLTVGSSGL